MRVHKEKSIVLLHGKIEEAFLDQLPKGKEVFICEGRPNLETGQYLIDQLKKRNITPTVIADNMAGFLCYQDWVKEIWVASMNTLKEGALCSIGSLILAVLGKKHGIPVKCFAGKKSNKFLASQKELVNFLGEQIAPSGAKGYAPLAEFVNNKYISKYYE